MDSFVREMPENVDKNKTWQWLSKFDMKNWDRSIVMCRTGAGHQKQTM